MEVKLVSYTKLDEGYLKHLKSLNPSDKFLNNVQNIEGLMAYVARVSSANATAESYEELLSYCMKNSHWSVFEMIDMTFEITTSRAIAQQIIRHRSFNFQEFSQRYAKVSMGYEIAEARRQDLVNRQNSISDMTSQDQQWFEKAQQEVIDIAEKNYEAALAKGIAKEQARFLLPLNTRTRIFMKGSLRSWIHYVELRSAHGTQKEHAEIAKAIGREIIKVFPVVVKGRSWNFSNS